MYGLILATCLTITPHCTDDTTRYDIIEVTHTLLACKNVLLAEPDERQYFLSCQEITPVDAEGHDIK